MRQAGFSPEFFFPVLYRCGILANRLLLDTPYPTSNFTTPRFLTTHFSASVCRYTLAGCLRAFAIAALLIRGRLSVLFPLVLWEYPSRPVAPPHVLFTRFMIHFPPTGRPQS